MTGIRTELLSSYAATASRIGAWAVVSALVYRMGDRQEFSYVAVARSSVTLLMYLSAGFVPVVLNRLVNALEQADALVPETAAHVGSTLGYASPRNPRYYAAAAIYAAAWQLILTAGLISSLAILAAPFLLRSPSSSLRGFFTLLVFMTAGMYVRILGDVAGSLLQARGRLAIDNAIISMGEWCWPAMLMIWEIALRPPGVAHYESAGAAFLISGLISTLMRLLAARVQLPLRKERGQRLWPVAASILAPASILVLGHLADFCYAPANQILLSLFSRPDGAPPNISPVADYAPAVQIDAALLLLTAAVSAVILPRATRALAAGDILTVRCLYLRGTASTFAVLLLAAIPTALLARPILALWLGPGVSHRAAAIVPLVLIHTVIGGSSGIARAVLLAAGKYRTYSAAALTAGLANVLLAAAVLKFTNLGIVGIVLVTVATVTARCALWMPWYTLRTLRGLRELANAPAQTIIPPTRLPHSSA